MPEPTYPSPVTLDPAWTADTVAVQAGRPARVPGAPMNPPITMSSTYVHDATLEYGRDGNTGWGALEDALGALDGGRAVTFASGLAAATAIADLVPPGGTVVLSSVTYYGVRNIFERMQARGRLHLRLVPADDTAALLAAADGADMVWVESIANPLMVVADVPAIAAGARERGAITRRGLDVRDAASPAAARPRRGHRPALGDEVHRRPFGPAARRRRVPGRRARDLPGRAPPRPWRDPRGPRGVPRVARIADARRPARSCRGDGRRARPPPGGAPADLDRPLRGLAR